jgi:catechol 2,3-dioxygenase-like lactoylglutathione lyase family enzyme/DNA-binding CsgD family transcriptional regulator
MARARRGRPPHPDVLTPAEWQVTDLTRHGLSNRAISELRDTSQDATKYHVANAIGKLGLAGKADLRHWGGIPDGSALQRRNDVDQRVRLGAIGQVSLPVGDIEQAVAWYRDVLALTHLYTFGTLAFFDCDGVRLFLSAEPSSPRPPSATILYFRVPDIQSAHTALAERGVAFEGAPHRIHRHADGTEEWMAFFRDPDGNLLALMSQVAPPSA